MPTTTIGTDAPARLRRRYRELNDVLDGVLAERELSVFLAHRRGMTDTAIADIVKEDATEVRRIIDSHRNDEHADTYEEGPRWVALWPHQGWSTTH
ncbi:MAG: hypothetical protein WCA46_15405 [Actinocatenispora sp.]